MCVYWCDCIMTLSYYSVSVDKICEMVSVGLSHSEQKLAAHHFDTIEKALTKKEVHN